MPTPTLTEGHNYLEIIYKRFFKKKTGRYPKGEIPSVKTDIKNLNSDANVLIWFGHSSYFIQLDGKRILVDPVFSGNASPLPNTVKSFPGTDIYSADDLPEIDYLFITHDHYDHVDYETLIDLKGKIKKIICGLGVGAHFEYWGYTADKIIEMDWFENFKPENDLTIYVEPARHFSGRGFARNTSLWVSFLLKSADTKIYIGGDSGYGNHYKEIGDKFGPIDIAILDNGQYDEAWKYIHHSPEDVLIAARDLKAKKVLPVHSSKFALANHPWKEPLIKISELNKSYHLHLITPVIGEVVYLNDSKQQFEEWWKKVK